MTAAQKRALRARQYTYYEVLSFAQFFVEHRAENSPENLLAAFLRWKEDAAAQPVLSEKLMLIEHAVVKYYGLNLQDVRGKRRYTELVTARQIIAYLTVKLASQNTVASTLGTNRNSIQYRKSKCGTLMSVEKQLCKEVQEIENALTAKFAAMDAATPNVNQTTNDNVNTEGNTAAGRSVAATA
jgi:chromosomal replication initiation ATPase DnaA